MADLTFTRFGYGAMQLAGPGVFGPPKDRDAAITVLRTGGMSPLQADTLHKVARRLETTPMSVALAWLLHARRAERHRH